MGNGSLQVWVMNDDCKLVRFPMPDIAHLVQIPLRNITYLFHGNRSSPEAYVSAIVAKSHWSSSWKATRCICSDFFQIIF